MKGIDLLASIGQHRILRGIIDSGESSFLGVILAWYLVGSYARLAIRRICRHVWAFENGVIGGFRAYLEQESACGAAIRETRAFTRLHPFHQGVSK